MKNHIELTDMNRKTSVILFVETICAIIDAKGHTSIICNGGQLNVTETVDEILSKIKELGQG